MSAPNKIIDIYKKLVFIKREPEDMAGYLMDTDPGTNDDTELSLLHNNFNLDGEITFSGTVKGADFTQGKDLDEILTALYGAHGGQLAQTTPFYYTLGGAMGASGDQLSDASIQANMGVSLAHDLVIESNKRFEINLEHKGFIDTIKDSLGLQSDYTWVEPDWLRIHLADDDDTAIDDFTDFNSALGYMDRKLKLDLDWLKGLQKTLDSGIFTGGAFGQEHHIERDDSTFQERYLSPYLNNTHYLGGQSGYLDSGTGHPTVNDITPTIGDFLSAILVIDDRIWNREKEIDALDTRLNLSTSTNPDGTNNVSNWNGISFHGHESSNVANEIDFDATETNLLNQTNSPTPNLGDALNMLIDRDENIYGMMDKRLSGTDSYTGLTTAENLQEAFNRIAHLDSAVSNIRLYAFGSDDENAYVSGNPQGASPGSYADLTNQVSGGTYLTSEYLENNIVLIDSKLNAIETFLTNGTSTTGNPNQTFFTDVNIVGDGTSNSLEDTINKIVDWFEQFCVIASPGASQPKAITSYLFDGDVVLDGGHDLLVQSDITLQRDNKTFAIKRAGGQNKFTVSSQTGDTYVAGNITTEGTYSSTGSISADDNITTTGGNISASAGSMYASTSITAGVDLNMSSGTANFDGVLDVSGQVDFHTGLDMNSNNITGLPTDAGASTDKAASVGYVQLVASGRIWDGAVEVVSDVEISNLASPGTIDGVTLSQYDRVCLINQGATGASSATENGVYVTDGTGGLVRESSGHWQSGQSNNLQGNISVFVRQGTQYNGTVFTVSNEQPAYTVDSDDIVMIQTDALQVFVPGNVTSFSSNSIVINGGDGINANDGWVYTDPVGNLSVKLAPTNPCLFFSSGGLKVQTNADNSINRTSTGIQLSTSLQTDIQDSKDITDGMSSSFWDDATKVGRIEAIDQDLDATASPTFVTVSADLSGNATTSSGCSGNSATATALATGRDIEVDGFVTGTGSGFDGTGNLTISTSLNGSIGDTNISSAQNWNDIKTQVDTYSGDWDNAYTHTGVTSGNPHNVTKADVTLDQVDNTADVDKPVSDATNLALADKVSLNDGNPQNAQQIINSPLLINQGDTDFTVFENSYAVGQDSAIVVNAPLTPNGGTNCENAFFVASTRDSLGRQGHAGFFLETTDGDGTCKSWAVLAKDSNNNDLKFFRQNDAQSGDFESMNVGVVFKLNGDNGAKFYEDLEVDGDLVVDGTISGNAVEDGTINNSGSKLTTENAVYDFVINRVGSTVFDLQDDYTQPLDGVSNEVPTLNCMFDYVQNNSPAGGIVEMACGNGITLNGVENVVGSQTAIQAVGINWESDDIAPKAWLNDDDSLGASTTDYDWDVGTATDKQYQVWNANESNGKVVINCNGTKAGTWRLLVKYVGEGGQKYIEWDYSDNGNMKLYTLHAGAQLAPPSDQREADLIIFTKFSNDYATVSVSSPLMELDNG